MSAARLALCLSTTLNVHSAPAVQYGELKTPAVQSYKLMPKIVDVFYNVYVGPNQSDAANIVNEQSSQLARREHRGDVAFNIMAVTIGGYLPDLLDRCQGCVRVASYTEGFEERTLQHLYAHCLASPTSRVMYIHNKGSFHNTRINEVLRRFLMKGVLSDQCLHMPDSCNTCSARFSPLPHPHTPGNMWVAKCDYIIRLIPPKEFNRSMHNLLMSATGVPQLTPNSDSGMGAGRFAFEHWVHSAPTVVPCDIYEGPFLWGYKGLPLGKWVAHVHVGIRFPLEVYGPGWKEQLQIWKSWRCFEYRSLYHQNASDATRAALGIDSCVTGEQKRESNVSRMKGPVYSPVVGVGGHMPASRSSAAADDVE